MTTSKTDEVLRQQHQTEPKVFNQVSPDSDITVLVVDDDPDLLDLTATFLAKEREEFDVLTTQFVDEGVEMFEEEPVDAIVSDYDMPKMNGLEFLDAIREQNENVPFILFTGKGSEEIASEAISSGVTDYLQKGTGASRYSLLANRIVNSVEKYRSSQRLKRSQEKFSKLVKNSSDMLAIVNDKCEFDYISPACERILGYSQADLIGECAFDYMPTEDRQIAMEEFFDALENPEKDPVIEIRFKQADGGTTLLEARGRNMFDDDLIDGFVVNGRDISDLKKREQKLKQQNEQLKDMQNVISHDLRNPLSIASDSLALYRETGDEAYLDKVDTALARMDTLIEQVLSMADPETSINETEQVALRDVARDAWEMIETDGVELHIDNSKQFEADADRFQQALENIFRNAVDHNSGEIIVRVGTDESSIYIEDNGSGVPPDVRDEIFESGYTTEAEHTGLGLNIVKQIVLGHGWDIDVHEGSQGGARFEITGVSFQPMVCE